MDIAFEFVRTVVTALSRRCTNFLINKASQHSNLQRRLIRFGHATNTTYVYMKYFNRLWFHPKKNNSVSTEGEVRITQNVKAITDEKALEVGSDTIGELAVISLMLVLVSIGIIIRRSKAKAAQLEHRIREDEIIARITELEETLQQVTGELKEYEKMLKSRQL